jgi:hypothetical protein
MRGKAGWRLHRVILKPPDRLMLERVNFSVLSQFVPAWDKIAIAVVGNKGFRCCPTCPSVSQLFSKILRRTPRTGSRGEKPELHFNPFCRNRKQYYLRNAGPLRKPARAVMAIAPLLRVGFAHQPYVLTSCGLPHECGIDLNRVILNRIGRCVTCDRK